MDITTEKKNEPEKLDLKSLDPAIERRKELIRLFPEARTEGWKIDFDQLKRALGETVDVRKERYGLAWPGKAECFKAIQAPTVATLRPVLEESVNFDTTENLIIEGDNLEVLKLLQKSYLGKVKMIYIDPPYNTGNDFIYPDNYAESLQTYLEYTGQVDSEGRKFGTNTEAEGRFHSKWLSMMYPRVYLARNLLAESGFVVVSIDDKEFQNLQRLLDEIFGEENRVAVLVYDRNRKNDAKLFSVGHEYMVVYARNLALLRELKLELRAPKEGVEEIRTLFERLRREHRDDWEKVASGLREYFSTFEDDDPRAPLARYSKVDKDGPYRTDGDPSWPGGGGPRYDVPHPITGRPCKVPSRGWVWPTYERMRVEIQKGLIHFGPDETTIPSIRRNLFEKNEQVMRSVHFSYAQKAAQDLTALFDGKKVFDNPKNYLDIAALVSYLTSSDDIILDFFAGSGTTGHAVLDVNRTQRSHRKFVLVQLPEPTGRDDFGTIADITRERIRRAIRRFNKKLENKLDLEGVTNLDLGFRAFQLAESNFRAWDTKTPTEPAALEAQLTLHIDHLRKDRTAVDFLFEILLKSGFPLAARVEKLVLRGLDVFSVAGGALFICLEHKVTLDAIRAMAEKKPARVVCLDESFAGNDQLKTNAVQTFKAKDVVFRTV